MKGFDQIAEKRRYREKLKDPRWQQKKSAIQIRDQFQCKKCGCKDNTLHVHHRFYKFNIEPWDYPDQLLVLLCAKCHLEEENSKHVLKDLVESLAYFGYYNTEIQAIINKLIESKMNHARQNNTPKDSQQ